MASRTEALDTSPARIGRGGFLARLGAAVVGVAALNTLATQKAALADPYCCNGDSQIPDCRSFGCGCPGRNKGYCCWYCTIDSECRTYQCCDHGQYTNPPCHSWCSCAYLVCNCC